MHPTTNFIFDHTILDFLPILRANNFLPQPAREAIKMILLETPKNILSLDISFENNPTNNHTCKQTHNENEEGNCIQPQEDFYMATTSKQPQEGDDEQGKADRQEGLVHYGIAWGTCSFSYYEPNYDEG
uniref:Uncharacterized protein n=1 Tax=Opuntia streptacantha TaxID=393608 RepID=A0A7C9DV57_OPUST